jgi:hypothetical protein
MEKRERKAKVRIPMMVDDARFAPQGRGDLTENVDIEDEFFLDGPVTRRVAVLDFNPDTGALEPGAHYLPPKPGKKLGRYDVPEKPDVHSRAFNQVSVFATVFETIKMFETADTLGREIRWAFNAPQLLVVPRAGQMENAYYERDTHSLQFFYFPSYDNETVFTSLARDIVAHETGHAILDGIAPHLWNAITPQCLALHEAIGDLSALLLSIESNDLRKAVLEKTQGSIKESTHFSALAEEFGMARGSGALRSLFDESLTLGQVQRGDPHDLCRVLTAALYSVLVKMHEDRKKEEMAKTGASEYSVSGRALALAAAQFRRMTMRALDYLPPGEISFADYGRAIIGADQASHPDDPQEREWIIDEFVRRGMVPNRGALQVNAPPENCLQRIDLQKVATSDWAAYDFANSEAGRQLLCIPSGMEFQMEPRLPVEKKFYHRKKDESPAEEMVREYLLKVWWYQEEENPLGPGFPSQRQIAVGTTLAWDHDTGEPRVLLTSACRERVEEQAEQQKHRNLMLRQLAEEGLLQPGPQKVGPDGRPLRMVVSVEGTNQIMRVANMARMLHIMK